MEGFRQGRVPLHGRGAFQIGNRWYTPGSFRKKLQTQDLQDTEPGRVRKCMKEKNLKKAK